MPQSSPPTPFIPNIVATACAGAQYMVCTYTRTLILLSTYNTTTTSSLYRTADAQPSRRPQLLHCGWIAYDTPPTDLPMLYRHTSTQFRIQSLPLSPPKLKTTHNLSPTTHCKLQTYPVCEDQMHPWAYMPTPPCPHASPCPHVILHATIMPPACHQHATLAW